MFTNTCKTGIKPKNTIYNLTKIIKSFLTSLMASPTSTPKISFTETLNSKMLSSMKRASAKLSILDWPKEPEPWSQWIRNYVIPPYSTKRRLKGTVKVLEPRYLVPPNKHLLSRMTTEQTFIVWLWWWLFCSVITKQFMKKDNCFQISEIRSWRSFLCQKD